MIGIDEQQPLVGRLKVSPNSLWNWTMSSFNYLIWQIRMSHQYRFLIIVDPEPRKFLSAACHCRRVSQGRAAGWVDASVATAEAI